MWVPAEGTNAELKNGEFVGGVFDFEVANIEAVEVEGFSPGGAGDAGHLKVNRHEIGVTDVVSELR